MNNKVNELLGKALDKQVPYTWHSLNRVQLDDVMKKFAELIVRECVSKIEDEIANARCVEPFELGYISGLSVATEVISQHLGAITTTGELG